MMNGSIREESKDKGSGNKRIGIKEEKGKEKKIEDS
jgi:hypothetical protein